MSLEMYGRDYLEFYDPNECIGDLGEKWCVFKWRLYNLQLNPKEIFQSPVFTTRLLPMAYWFLEIKLSTPGNLRKMEITLYRFPNYENTSSIVDVSYKVICHKEVQISDKYRVTYDNEFPCGDMKSYWASFYRSKQDYTTIECRLRPNKVMLRNVIHHNLDKKLPIHLRKLLQSGELADAVIHVGDHQLVAHKSILHARLPNLMQKCLDKSSEDKYIFKIDDLPVSVVKEMLKYAYTGQAYVDLESASVNKNVVSAYSQNFVQTCCWDDNPFAQTSFNYETDSLLWDLKDIFIKPKLARKSIDLLRLQPSKFEFTLVVEESENGQKWLMLAFKFLSVEMPKPTLVSCNNNLVNKNNKETFELGENETLLLSYITSAKVKICSLLQVKEGKSFLRATEDSLMLKIDFKFCYGSSKSSIENLYNGQFDISQCTSCAVLSADMEALFNSSYFSNITVESGDGHRFYIHKEILICRWPESDKLNVKEKKHVVIEGSAAQGLKRILLQLYKGISSI